MYNKNRMEIVAGIDVGSYAVRMKIAEIKDDAQVKTLDLVQRPIALGRDTFTSGKVDFETVLETCEILKDFQQLLKEYRIQTYRAVATSAVREARNRDYIIDQIRQKTGLTIDVLSNAEERFLTYKSINENLSGFFELRDQGAMLVDIGSGSIQLTVYKHQDLVFSQNIQLGSLRVREVLSSIESRTLDFLKLLDEFINCHLDKIRFFEPESILPNFIALGGEMGIIAMLCNKTEGKGVTRYIKKTAFDSLYREFLTKPVQIIEKAYGIPQDRMDILIPSMLIFKKFLDLTCAEGIYTPMVSLRDGVVSDLADKKFTTGRSELFFRDMITSARFLGRRYKYDQAHAEAVEEKALALFDGLKRLHGLGERERLLLQLAAIFHDIGIFISLNQHYIHSYELIMASDLLGTAQEELAILANVARYHSTLLPDDSHENFNRLGRQHKLVVAKLAAMLRIADALDRSHKQKIKGLNITAEETEVVIRVEASEDILLEVWNFETQAEYFQEVFGIKPILKLKRKMGNE